MREDNIQKEPGGEAEELGVGYDLAKAMFLYIKSA